MLIVKVEDVFGMVSKRTGVVWLRVDILWTDNGSRMHCTHSQTHQYDIDKLVGIVNDIQQMGSICALRCLARGLVLVTC